MMVVTLRTLPRSDGSTSVVLTRDPADDRDPEVVNVFPTSHAAVRWALDMGARIEAQAGARMISKHTTTKCPEWGPWRARVRLVIAVAPGEHVRLG